MVVDGFLEHGPALDEIAGVGIQSGKTAGHENSASLHFSVRSDQQLESRRSLLSLVGRPRWIIIRADYSLKAWICGGRGSGEN